MTENIFGWLILGSFGHPDPFGYFREKAHSLTSRKLSAQRPGRIGAEQILCRCGGRRRKRIASDGKVS